MKLTPLPLTVSAIITVGLPANRFGPLKSIHHLLHVVTVDLDHFPAEAAIFFRERIDIHHIAHPAIDLQAILVHDPDQIVQLVMAGFHGRFPDGAFLLFAVAHNAKSFVVLVVELDGERDANGNAEPLTERSGGDLNAGQLEPIRMSLIRRPQLAQRDHILDRIEAGEGKAEVGRSERRARHTDR